MSREKYSAVRFCFIKRAVIGKYRLSKGREKVQFLRPKEGGR